MQLHLRSVAKQDNSVVPGRIGEVGETIVAGDRAASFVDDLLPEFNYAGSEGSGGALQNVGAVHVNPPPNATAAQVLQVQAYVNGANQALEQGLLMNGRVSTKGELRAAATAAAAAERSRAAAAGAPTYLTAPKSSHTFVYVSTIQRMARNLFGAEGCFVQSSGDTEAEADADRLDIPIHAFDLILADECHRGYTAQEMSVWRDTLKSLRCQEWQ